MRDLILEILQRDVGKLFIFQDRKMETLILLKVGSSKFKYKSRREFYEFTFLDTSDGSIFLSTISAKKFYDLFTEIKKH